MLSIRLKPALERRLSHLARQTGRTKTFYATKLIEGNIEDLEDRYLAEARLENRGKRHATAQVRRQLGLDDCVRRWCRPGPQKTRSSGTRRNSRFYGKAQRPGGDPRSFGERCEDVLNLGGEQWLLPLLARIDQTKWKANGKGMQRSVTPK